MLLAFDLDKTLVTDDYRLPEETLAAVQAARRRGHIVTVLTGRPLRSARAFLDLLEIEVPHAVNHGSYVRDREGGVLRRMRLATAQVDSLLEEHLNDATVEFSCVVDDVLYVRDPRNERWDWVHAESRAITRFQVGLGLAADKVVFHGATRTPAL
ncbi:MAG: HAD family phosphatase, partial [Trueperaceae bacterium]|nr:HAD family phosphatase [Trueperaceae bacterium]